MSVSIAATYEGKRVWVVLAHKVDEGWWRASGSATPLDPDDNDFPGDVHADGETKDAAVDRWSPTSRG